MVRITSVHTGRGDEGETDLVGMSRISKSSYRIIIVGECDELNALVGVIRMECARLPIRHADGALRATVRDIQVVTERCLGRLQNELFDVGAELACPVGEIPEGMGLIDESNSDSLLTEIDAWLEDLEPLSSFILPTGEGPVAWLQVARAVCRRFERSLVRIREEDGEESVRSLILTYVNRLSDWLFVLGRWMTAKLGGEEALWVPIAKRPSTDESDRIRLQRENEEAAGQIDL